MIMNNILILSALKNRLKSLKSTFDTFMIEVSHILPSYMLKIGSSKGLILLEKTQYLASTGNWICYHIIKSLADSNFLVFWYFIWSVLQKVDYLIGNLKYHLTKFISWFLNKNFENLKKFGTIKKQWKFSSTWNCLVATVIRTKVFFITEWLFSTKFFIIPCNSDL